MFSGVVRYKEISLTKNKIFTVCTQCMQICSSASIFFSNKSTLDNFCLIVSFVGVFFFRLDYCSTQLLHHFPPSQPSFFLRYLTFSIKFFIGSPWSTISLPPKEIWALELSRLTLENFMAIGSTCFSNSFVTLSTKAYASLLATWEANN